MSDTATLARFAATTLLMELTPGPNMAFLVTLAAERGRAAGVAMVAGIALALGLVGLACAFGLAGAAAQMPWLKPALGWAGSAFLVWLAIEAWRDAGGGGAADGGPGGPLDERSLWVWFRRGVAVNLLNPKAAAFYLSVLPGFLVTGAGTPPHLQQALLLTGLAVGIATLVHLALVAGAGALAPVLTRPERRRAAQRAMAVALLVVAVWFAVTVL
jgi:threonine/homoserine/homoserine lactone efflux protein